MEKFTSFMNCYPIDDELIDSAEQYYILLNDIAKDINVILEDKYIVKASCGQGRLSDVPWICIFNKNITVTASKGIYIAILFKADMSGFYLTLMQGMQSFKDIYGIKGLEYLNKVSEYYRNQINTDLFYLDEISLGVEKGSRGYGYEQGTIIAKFYRDNDMETFENDLKILVKIYDDLYDSMHTLSYNEVIQNIINDNSTYLVDVNEANKLIKNQVCEQNDVPKLQEIVLLSEIDIPKVTRNKYESMTKKAVRKIDGIAKAKKDVKIGLIGEQLVFDYEIQKMKDNHREDLIDKIKWVSKENDICGYDIISYDFDKNGVEYEIFIEVKTTGENEKSAFYISKNELKVMKENSEKYLIYRVFNNPIKPIFYKIRYSDLIDKFDVSVFNYIVNIDGGV